MGLFDGWEDSQVALMWCHEICRRLLSSKSMWWDPVSDTLVHFRATYYHVIMTLPNFGKEERELESDRALLFKQIKLVQA
ncbi:hypothetical protein B0O99DRAFT_71685 [Bisporella sp. PMI_857]|nr:hypothetical protein B0O99DRAFT_71685 [Bisporella sp. PMI_857]